MGKAKYICKYCGSKNNGAGGICRNCSDKLTLIRKIQRMVREYKEQLENDNQRTAER